MTTDITVSHSFQLGQGAQKLGHQTAHLRELFQGDKNLIKTYWILFLVTRCLLTFSDRLIKWYSYLLSSILSQYISLLMLVHLSSKTWKYMTAHIYLHLHWCMQTQGRFRNDKKQWGNIVWNTIVMQTHIW